MTQYKDLYQLAFGYVAPPFPWGGVPDPANLIPLKSVILGGRAQNRDGIRQATVLKTPEFFYPLPNEPIVKCNGGKEIETTALWGMGNKKGTVKEISANRDWNIVIEGLIVNLDEDDMPDEEMGKLMKILNHNGPITIDNEYCRALGISQAVVVDFDFPNEPGEGVRYQKYSIVLVSDQDFDLEINT